MYDGIHASLESKFVEYQLEHLDIELNALNTFLTDGYSYSQTNPKSIFYDLMQTLQSGNIVPELRNPVQSEAVTNRFETVEQELLVLLNSSPLADGAIKEKTRQRDDLLRQALDGVKSDMNSYEEVIGLDANYLIGLEAQVERLVSVLLKNNLPESNSSSAHSSLQELRQSIMAQNYDDLYDAVMAIYQKFIAHQEHSENQRAMKQLLQTIPRLDAATIEVKEVISSFVFRKLGKIWDEIEKTKQRQAKYMNMVKQLDSSKIKFEKISDALIGLSELREGYEKHHGYIFELERERHNLNFDITRRSRQDSEIARQKMETLMDAALAAKKNPEYAAIRRILFNRSLLLPELQYFYHELDPLNEIGVSQHFTTKDYDADFILLKELSSRVHLVNQPDGTMSVLKKFDKNRDRSMLKHAVEILGRLRHHPNILKLNAIVNGPMNVCVYLEHPYYPLGDLMEWRLSNNYDNSRLGRIFFDVVKGLQALHENDIIHRDLKPQNILISETGAVLADFDLSEFQLPQLFITSHTLATVPQTINFIAPEVLSTNKHTIESDLYALGITIYTIVTNPTAFIQNIDTFHIALDSSELTADQRDLVLNLTNKEQRERMQLKYVLKNPFIRGEKKCTICMESKMELEGLICDSNKHLICFDCFEQYAVAESQKDVSYLIERSGLIKCPSTECDQGHFSFDYVCKNTSSQVVNSYLLIQRKLAEEIARVNERSILTEVMENERLQQQEINQQLQNALLSNNQQQRDRTLECLRTEKMFQDDEYTRTCPGCLKVVQKIGGCNDIVCGSDADTGANRQNGCGRKFNFRKASRYISKVANLEGTIAELSRPLIRRTDLN